ncbi:DDHD domain-containing protein [Chlamydoabsidia padenii]|nr:DDHD domain-containing protein [Chlamydoabsidia padenii]
MEKEDFLNVYQKRRSVRPTSILPDPDVPPLTAHWFHALDQPVVDPLAIRRAKSTNNLKKTPPKSPSSPKLKPPSKWIAFSKRDSAALEKAYQDNDVRAKVLVNEDQLFEVDVYERRISPVYWEGATYEVRRATWFMQGDGSKWVPCEENLSEQIEIGYYKHKPYNNDTLDDSTTMDSAASKRYSFPQAKTDEPSSSTATVEEKKLEMTLAKQPVEKQWNLLGRYLGQYIVYTGADTAWLLSNSASSKIAKSIITRLTNKQNMGGTRLIRGYSEVEKQRQSSKTTKATTISSSPKPPLVTTTLDDKGGLVASSMEGESDRSTIPTQETTDEYHAELDEDDEIRKIDHLVFAVHGIGQKMTEKTGQNFVDDIISFRKTIKTAYSTGIAATTTPHRSNGILVLPILWRQDIKFGIASDDDESIEADLGMLGIDDGCPTLDELTLDGIPNIRTVVSDVLMDIPLYMTPKYRDQMIGIISKEMNRVYGLYTQRNPSFVGKVTIVGHSLGSMLAFDMLTSQPFDGQDIPHSSLSHPSSSEKRPPPLNFSVQNFFAVGSPLGIILLLKGFKIGSRKSLTSSSNRSFADVSSTSASPIPVCYPAIENLYNIFHKADPVAYRLEPLISRHYSSKMKPEPIPYAKGGLKGVFDAGYNVGSGIANRAGAMYESIKVGFTTNLLMRGLGLSRQQMYASSTTTTDEEEQENDDDDDDDDDNDDSDVEPIATDPPQGAQSESTSPSTSSSRKQQQQQQQPYQFDNTNNNGSFSNRIRSNSDPAYMFAMNRPSSGLKATHTRQSPPAPLPQQPHSHGARKLKQLNLNGRVDYALQEGLLENPYLNAFNAHMQYWHDIDVAAFIVRETYR